MCPLSDVVTDIPISAVRVTPEEERLVLDVLRSGRLVQGPMVQRFEAACAAMAGTRHAVALSSGTAALEAALEAHALAPGDEVLTSPFTFVATLNAILRTGCVATFADVGDDFTLDLGAAAAAIAGRTRVLLPVHLYGLAADMDRLAPLAAEHGLAIVEDAAQAHGARVGDRPIGSYGAGCFSFYATKNVSAGEGGALTTDDDAFAERIRVLRNQGMRNRYDYEVPGHNFRMTELQAALGVGGLARLESALAARRRNAALLTEGLEELPGVVVPGEPAGRTHAWHQYTVRITTGARTDRDTVRAGLADSGIATGVYYPRPVFDYDCFRDHPRVRIGSFPTAERFATEVLSLPVHPGLSDQNVARIVDTMRELLGP